MKTSLLLLSLLLPALPLQATLITVFSDYGTGSNPPFDPTFGDTVTNGSNNLSPSFAFTVGGSMDLALNQIIFTASIGTTDTTNSVTLSIEKDNGGIPGTTVFTSAPIVNQMGVLGSGTNPPVTIDYSVVSGGTILKAGSTYWLTLSAPDSTHVAWNANGNGTNGTEQFLLNGVWTSSPKELGAFAIIASTPEPGTLFLLTTGFAFLSFRYRRRLGIHVTD